MHSTKHNGRVFCYSNLLFTVLQAEKYNAALQGLHFALHQIKIHLNCMRMKYTLHQSQKFVSPDVHVPILFIIKAANPIYFEGKKLS
jgi:hypothetical protein